MEDVTNHFGQPEERSFWQVFLVPVVDSGPYRFCLAVLKLSEEKQCCLFHLAWGPCFSQVPLSVLAAPSREAAHSSCLAMRELV